MQFILYNIVLLACVSLAYLQPFPVRDSVSNKAALQQLFGQIDQDGDGQIDLHNAFSFFGSSELGKSQEFDSIEERTAAYQQMIASLDGADVGETISEQELEVHLSGQFRSYTVVDWIKYGLGHEQYVSTFEKNAISPLDFPALLRDDGLLLQQELGINSQLHRTQIVRAMQRQILGLGEVPSPPTSLSCLCKKGVQLDVGQYQKYVREDQIVLIWNEPHSLGYPIMHAYMVEYQCQAGPPAWQELDLRIGQQTFVYADVALRDSCKFRVYAWNSYGRSNASEIIECQFGDECVKPIKPERNTVQRKSQDNTTFSLVTYWFDYWGSSLLLVLPILMRMTNINLLIMRILVQIGNVCLRIVKVPHQLFNRLKTYTNLRKQQQQKQKQQTQSQLQWKQQVLSNSSNSSFISEYHIDADRFNHVRSQSVPANLDNLENETEPFEQRRSTSDRYLCNQRQICNKYVRYMYGGGNLSSGSSCSDFQVNGPQYRDQDLRWQENGPYYRDHSTGGSQSSSRQGYSSRPKKDRNYCQHGGCNVCWKRWYIRADHLTALATSHYCGICQNHYCKKHTRVSPHGNGGRCGQDSACICVNCFNEFPPEAQLELDARNKLNIRKSSHGSTKSEEGSDNNDQNIYGSNSDISRYVSARSLSSDQAGNFYLQQQQYQEYQMPRRSHDKHAQQNWDKLSRKIMSIVKWRRAAAQRRMSTVIETENLDSNIAQQ
eukprot:TRINITY_DN4974_c0_g1_i3.p1 TRINITY_DN4974_c0_g1~~TRINITY_DN4974_c0_g1_i3.p1  ORF type:complete len:718 (-),score=57.28 TRINITY_DN4974_c0_g1_i3:1340-3493(-)